MADSVVQSMEFRIIMRAMEVLRTKVYNELPIQQIYLLLLVAEHEGITLIELKDNYGFTQSSISKNIRRLGTCMQPYDPSKRDELVRQGRKIIKDKVMEGLDLVKTERDLYNPRTLSIYLTDKGKVILKEITKPL